MTVDTLSQLCTGAIEDVQSIVDKLSIEFFFRQLKGTASSLEIPLAEYQRLEAVLFFLTSLLAPIAHTEGAGETGRRCAEFSAEAFEYFAGLSGNHIASDELSYRIYSAINYSAAAKFPSAELMARDEVPSRGTIQADASTVLMALLRSYLLSVVRNELGTLSRFDDADRVTLRGKVEEALKVDPALFPLATAVLLIADGCHSFARYFVGGVRQDLDSALARLRDAERLSETNGFLAEVVAHLGILMNHMAEFATLRVLQSVDARLPPEYLTLLTQGLDPIFQLWPSQVAALRRGLLNSTRFAVNLPASAGKTLLAEMKLAQMLSEGEGLAFYVVPLNALARQVQKDLQIRLRPAPLRFRIKVLTGTYEIEDEDLRLERKESVIITTPEKLDGLLRNRDNIPEISALLERVRLFVFDECHSVGVGERGVTYELLIARISRMFPDAGMLALSAVFENIADFAGWIGAGDEGYISDAWRPTRLNRAVWGEHGLVYDDKWRISGYERTDNLKEDIARIAIELQRGYKSVLILAPRRDWAETYAVHISENLRRTTEAYLSGNDLDRLRELAEHVRARVHRASHLATMIEQGVAYHHAHVPGDVRGRIEDYIASGVLKFVVSTTTLAEGLNFPIRCVVIPSIFWGTEPMSPLQLQNIIGRAGRAHVSTNGQAIIFKKGDWVKYGTDWYRFEEFAFSPPKKVLKVGSSLKLVCSDDRSAERFSRIQKLDSQLLAFLDLPEIQTEGQSLEIAKSTFLAKQDRESVMGLGGVVESRLTEMTQTSTPLLEAASPFHLTAFGRIAKQTGFGARDVWRLRHRIDELRARDSSFFETLRVNDKLDQSKLKEWLRLIFIPFDNLLGSEGIRRESKRLFGLSISKVLEDVTSVVELMEKDADLNKAVDDVLDEWDVGTLLRWIQGATHDEISQTFLKKKHSRSQVELDRGLMDAIHFIESSARNASWALYAANIIAEFSAAHQPGMSVADEFWNIAWYVRLGVGHPVAAYLLDRDLSDRVEAVRLSVGLPTNIRYNESGKRAIRSLLLFLGEQEIRKRVVDESRAKKLWEALSSPKQ